MAENDIRVTIIRETPQPVEPPVKSLIVEIPAGDIDAFVEMLWRSNTSISAILFKEIPSSVRNPGGVSCDERWGSPCNG